MRAKTQAVDRELAKRFGKQENVILWHISNELGGNFGGLLLPLRALPGGVPAVAEKKVRYAGEI